MARDFSCWKRGLRVSLVSCGWVICSWEECRVKRGDGVSQDRTSNGRHHFYVHEGLYPLIPCKVMSVCNLYPGTTGNGRLSLSPSLLASDSPSPLYDFFFTHLALLSFFPYFFLLTIKVLTMCAGALLYTTSVLCSLSAMLGGQQPARCTTTYA